MSNIQEDGESSLSSWIGMIRMSSIKYEDNDYSLKLDWPLTLCLISAS